MHCTKKERRREAALRRKRKEKRKRRLRRSIIVATAVLLIVSFGFWVTRSIIHSRRLHTVYVDISAAPAEMRKIVTETIPPDSGIVIREEDSRTEADVVLTATGGAGVLPAKADIGGSADKSTTGITIAADPYVFVYDHRFGTPPDPLSIPEFSSYLVAIPRSFGFPLVVAGDEEDFAALYLYLREELNGSGMVLELLQAWRDAGILPQNWLDYDETALLDTIRSGGAATYIMRRSAVKALPKEERFYLRIRGLPVGEGNLQTREVGSRFELVPGSGPRNDAFQAVAALLLTDEVQTRLEEETVWSPVALEGAPLNREHRDIVRRLRTSAEFIDVTPELLAEAREEHIRLR